MAPTWHFLLLHHLPTFASQIGLTCYSLILSVSTYWGAKKPDSAFEKLAIEWKDRYILLIPKIKIVQFGCNPDAEGAINPSYGSGEGVMEVFTEGQEGIGWYRENFLHSFIEL